MKYVEGGDDFGEKNRIQKQYSGHLDIPPEKEKYTRKNTMYQTQKCKHVKIIPSGLEKQEKISGEGQKMMRFLLKRKTHYTVRA